MTQRYNHMVSIAFTVISDDPEGNDITPIMLMEALARRTLSVSQADEWLEACLPPLDTYAQEN